MANIAIVCAGQYMQNLLLYTVQMRDLSGNEALSGENVMQIARNAVLPRRIANFDLTRSLPSCTSTSLLSLFSCEAHSVFNRAIPAIDPSKAERNVVNF